MKLFPDGDRVFEAISRYDDLLTMDGREGYEPGDTLALIVPFLVLHNISEIDIKNLAAKATLTSGATNLVSLLKSTGWEVFCITTTYEQYANPITQKLGISASNLASMPFPLDRFREILCQEDTSLLQNIEQDIINIGDDDGTIEQKLDDFFWKKLPRTQFGRAIKDIKPIGGRRKVAALNNFCQRFSQPLSSWVVVGDSITDFRILKEVDHAGGLAVAFNANQYALPYATMSLASTDISDLAPVLKAWQEGGSNEVKGVVKAKEKAGGSDNRDNFHWLADKKDINDIVSLHKRIRRLVREEAGKLG